MNELSYKALASGLVEESQSSPHQEDSPLTTDFCTLHIDVFATYVGNIFGLFMGHFTFRMSGIQWNPHVSNPQLLKPPEFFRV